VSDGPRLDWGLLTAFDPDRAARVPPDLGRIWQLAGESLNLVARPIERFELAGTLNGHPGHVRSDRAKQSFPAIFAVAVTGYRAREPLRSYSRATARSALLSWADVYRPTGNPIDEWFFVPLLQAVDLVAWSLPRGEQAALRDWAQAFVTTGDRFYDRKAAGNSARANNWMARRLLIRAVACTVAGDAAGRAEMPGMLRDFVARNFVAGPSGQRDGRTFDFLQRDALHYHVAAVQPLLEVALYAPDLVDRTTRAAVLSGLEFLRPFFLGHAEHVEFARTSVAFDRERRDDGNPAFRDAPWEPAGARVLLRLARAAFPQVRDWTEDIVDPRYDPRTKLLAAVYGEPQRRACWP
jgi:Alginate lyase